ncbi:hypothetical protein P280DRAFT_474007 [Massarina eburnea CBS 473.64]|uniref:RRM domain-containing protein n=1 Tax=Massarina eburnea CBS 473.64 TaxID=1395130 RepID=A0A6A6RKU8_9PLEO|nr:hypothetical protein P280DRAFT_474007 [Massarina eburnea CBS 473.64]
MAGADLKSKKRKSASETEPKPKKQKSDVPATGTRKSSRNQKAAVEPLESLPAATKTAKATRPRAEDFFDAEAPAKVAPKQKKSKKSKEAAPVEAEEAEIEKPTKKSKQAKEPAVEAAPVAEAPKAKAKKGKKGKAVEEAAEVEAPVVEETVVVAEEKPVVAEKKTKKAKSKKQEDAPVVEVEEVVAETENAEDEEDLDDQTAALLAGFESDRDESDEEKDGEFDEKAVTVPELSKKQRKALEKVRKDAEPGVVFLGRVPHGFFEPQMKKYFGQFGDVKRLRLSRNKKTGASKHYAFIEFANGDVADIVAKTMHNYLMFGHILQCKAVPAEQVHPDLFKGANERFKVDPRNKKAGLAMERGAVRAQWEKRVEKENKHRTKQAKALKDEFDYEFSAPTVMAVDDVPKQVDTAAGAEAQLELETPIAEVTDVVEVESKPDQITVTETVTTKKGKKGAKGKAVIEPATKDAAETAEPAKAPKAKKDRKRKSDVTIEAVEAIEEPEAVAEAPAPAPKAKKAKKTAKAVDEATPDKKRKVAAEQEVAKPKKAKKAKA